MNEPQKSQQVRTAFRPKELDNKISQLDPGANGEEEEWVMLRDKVYHTTFTYLDRNTGKHQDWFCENDEEI